MPVPYETARLSRPNVDCLARTLVRLTAAEVEALRHFDDRLAERIGTSGPDAFRKLVQRLVNQIRKDHGQTSAQQARAEALGTISPRRDRTGFCLHAEWETERGTAVHAAITREMRDVATELGRDHGWTPDQLGAQAIHDLILRGAAMRRNQQLQRPQVVINVLCDRDTLSTGPHDRSIIETFDGQPLSPSQLDRMCCDAVLRRLDAAPDADVQAALPVRTPTPAQRAALRTLYDGCAISGAPWSQCEIHHVVSFSESKRTVLSELVPLSRRWHHLVHDDRWRLEMDSDRTLRVFQPDGTAFGSFDPPTPANHRTLPLAA